MVAGAKHVFVMMRHVDKHGRSKLVKSCTFPLTGMKCVSLVFTDMGVFECNGDHFVVREIAPNFTEEEVRSATDAPVTFAKERAREAV